MKDMIRKNWLRVIPYIIACIALCMGAFYDYQITDALYGKLPIIDMFIERIIIIPMEILVVFTICVWFRTKRHFIFLIGAVLTSIYTAYEAIKPWMSHNSVLYYVLIVIFAIIILGMCYIIVCTLSSQTLYHIRPFLTYMTTILIMSVLITTIIKIFWGRIRYRDMQDVTQFCTWYKPCGLFGNRSFPSGHTTTMCSVLALLQWKSNAYERVSIVRYILVGSIIMLTIIARMAAGAHFLSDTAMGFIITYSIYLCMTYWFRKRGYL